MPKTLVIYQYYEASPTYRQNLEYFLGHGYRGDLEYVIVISGGCTVELPTRSNIRYEFVPNSQFDYGAIAFVLNHTVQHELHKYRNFVFVNSSVGGPYLPSYWNTSWVDPFLDLLVGDVKLVGATICIPRPGGEWSEKFKARHGGEAPYSHVQTMTYAMDRAALQFLLAKGFFKQNIGTDKGLAIVDYEILMSQLILRNGWNISCLLPEYQLIDYRQPHSDMNPTSGDGDPSFSGGYFGRSPHPFETIFVKTNRNVVEPALLAHLEATQTPGRRNAASAYKSSSRERVLQEIVSAWKANRTFATWLVNRIEPTAVADLGVDFGFSSLCFALPEIGHVWGIDSFQGDAQTGFRDTRTQVDETIAQLGLSNITLVQGYFEEVSKTWEQELDILHLDGLHTYESVRRDFDAWIKFVKPTGVILLHSTGVPHFGVRRLFDEIDLPKTNLGHSHGLGVVSRDRGLVLEVAAKFERLIEAGSTSL